jgi:uncharacterized membrane protein YcaP (DUF421 family)
VYLPSPDRYDLAVLVALGSLFFLAFVVYPVELFQVFVWLVAFTVVLAWVAYVLQKWGFEE